MQRELTNDMRIYTSTASALENTDNEAVWKNVSDTDELVSLEGIPVEE